MKIFDIPVLVQSKKVTDKNVSESVAFVTFCA